ncbi:EAL domain-containing protein [Eionea flava]
MNSNVSIQRTHAVTKINNRRSDQAVRSAIDDIQNLLFDPQASSKIFSLLLEHVMNLTQSDFGVILLANEAGSLPITEDGALFSLFCSKNNTPFCRETVIQRWIKQKALPLRPTFFNAPISASYQKLLIDPEPLQSLMILPIVSHNGLRAICILSKRMDDYQGSTVRRVLPLLGSIICTLQSAESINGQIEGLDKKIASNRYLSSLFSWSPTAILVVSPEDKILTSNPAARDMFFRSSQSIDAISLSGLSIQSLIPNFESLFQWSKQHLPYGSEKPITTPRLWEEETAQRIDGERFLINLTVFRYTHGNQQYTTLQIHDITAIREKADEYHQASQELSALTHLVPVGIIRIDISWCCVYANDKWHEFTGLTKEESSGQLWINAIHSDDVKGVLDELRDALQVGNDYQKEFRLVSPLGQTRWVELNMRVLFDESGNVEGFLGSFADVTERLLHQEKLRHIAEYDGLTGLANRNLFQDRLQQAFYLSERDDSLISLLFLDLDGFKDVNDTLGHDAGDVLLQQVADRLINTLRRNDTVARFGGDEFVVLLGKDDHDNNSALVAQKIIDAIAESYMVNDHEVFMTVSVGISEGTHFDSSPEKVLKQADTALYLAKREGKNNYQLFTSKLDDDSKERVSLINQLRHAINRERYQLFYQPVFDIQKDCVIGFEALLRFYDNTNKIVRPEKFIPILEETNMMSEVGTWVFDSVCQQLKFWQSSGSFPDNGFIAFNVSPKQLLDDSFSSTIKSIYEKYDVDTKHIVMEITETVIIDKPQKVKKILNDIKSYGIRLSLDDFGTGYSSLSYLQNYPFDHIKIDKSFVDDLYTDSKDAKITKAIIALADSMNLSVTAEGVENSDSLSFLTKLGAHLFQGYYLSKPVPADLAITFVDKSACSCTSNIQPEASNETILPTVT